MQPDSFDFDDIEFTPDSNNALGNTEFTPAFDFDEFEPDDFELDSSTIPEFESPNFGINEPIFESKSEFDLEDSTIPGFELPNSEINEPTFEFEPEFDLEDSDFGLDSFDPVFLPANTQPNDPPIADPADELILPINNNQPVFRPLSVTINGVGSSFNDSLTGSIASNNIDGLGGDDIIDGLGGNDRLIGGRGNDFLRGGTGNDRLIGTKPTDIVAGRGELDGLLGGTGADAFVLGDGNGAYYTGAGSATIWDFNARAGDSIVLTGSARQYSVEANAFGDTNIFRGTDLIAVVYDTDVVPPTSLDFV